MGDEQTYVSRLKEGDEGAFDYLYTVWSGKLYNFVMRISDGDTYMAEEMVQSAFIKVWEGRRQLDPAKSFGAYLCTIAKNLLMNIYQHRMLEVSYQKEAADKIPASDTDTEKVVEYHFLEDYVNTLIARLPPARREIYILSKQERLSNREIAEKLNLSENTIEVQLTKASRFLREHILKHYDLSVSVLLCMLSIN